MTVFFDLSGAVYSCLREHMEPLLTERQFRLHQDVYDAGTFGNRATEYRESHRHRVIRIFFDGKDGLFGVAWSPSFRESEAGDWREIATEPFDRHTMTADQCESMIERLRDALAAFLNGGA